MTTSLLAIVGGSSAVATVLGILAIFVGAAVLLASCYWLIDWLTTREVSKR